MKYKAGDTAYIVDVIGSLGVHGFPLGTKVTIGHVFDAFYRADIDSDYWYVEDAELSDTPPEIATPTTKKSPSGGKNT